MNKTNQTAQGGCQIPRPKLSEHGAGSKEHGQCLETPNGSELESDDQKLDS